MSGSKRISRYDFALKIVAEVFDFDKDLIKPITSVN